MQDPQYVDGVFTALIQLRAAIDSGDQRALEAAVGKLDSSATNLSFSRAELGTRLKSIDALATRLDSDSVLIKGAVSLEIEVDFTAAISELASRQSSFDASLQVSAMLAKTTLLDFL